jgi:hypothetical protein
MSTLTHTTSPDEPMSAALEGALADRVAARSLVGALDLHLRCVG